jgi:hypothetical protein
MATNLLAAANVEHSPAHAAEPPASAAARQHPLGLVRSLDNQPSLHGALDSPGIMVVGRYLYRQGYLERSLRLRIRQ